MKKIRNFLALTLFMFLFTHASLSSAQTQFVNISGTVTFGDTDLIAMVLANGRYMFTGNPVGIYDLDVPLDGNGQITLYAFVSGFAPFREILTPDGDVITHDIQMMRSDSTKLPQIYLHENRVHGEDPSLRTITGNVKFDRDFLCSMVIANGQSTFTCDDFATFELHVPLDAAGNITFFCFIAGFSPFKLVFDPTTLGSSDILLDPVAITYHQRLLGEWRFQSTAAGFDKIYTLTKITQDSPSVVFPIYVIGSDETDSWDIAAAYYTDFDIYIVQDPDLVENQSVIYNMFQFNFIDDNSVMGIYYQADGDTGEAISDMYDFTGTKLSDL